MRISINGPKRMPSDDPRDPWPHMHVELDMPYLPAVGETIILNSGGSFKVQRRMFWVDGPENDGYWDWNADYETSDGVFKIAHLDVLPSDYDEPFTYGQAVTEGTERGHEQAAAEVEKLLNLASAPGVDPASVLAMLREWSKDSAARGRERAEQAARHHELAEQIMAQLQERRENSD